MIILNPKDYYYIIKSKKFSDKDLLRINRLGYELEPKEIERFEKMREELNDLYDNLPTEDELSYVSNDLGVDELIIDGTLTLEESKNILEFIDPKYKSEIESEGKVEIHELDRTKDLPNYLTSKIPLIDKLITAIDSLIGKQFSKFGDPEFLFFYKNEIMFMLPQKQFITLLWHRHNYNEEEMGKEFEIIKPYIRIGGSKGKRLSDLAPNTKTKHLDDIKPKDIKAFDQSQINLFNEHIHKLYLLYNLDK